MPTLRFVPPYYDHPAYIDALAARVRVTTIKWQPDCHLITFHGIPQRYVDEGDPYRSHCEETARLLPMLYSYRTKTGSSASSRALAEKLGYVHTDETPEHSAEKGLKLLATCPVSVRLFRDD